MRSRDSWDSNGGVASIMRRLSSCFSGDEAGLVVIDRNYQTSPKNSNYLDVNVVL